ncbi:hypothetical protein Hanom_Chr16g01492711 [Helianthus anomalus]
MGWLGNKGRSCGSATWLRLGPAAVFANMWKSASCLSSSSSHDGLASWFWVGMVP